MGIFEQLLNTPAADAYRFLFVISGMAIVAAVVAISTSLIRIVSRVMDNNSTLMQQQVITMKDISAALALHNNAAVSARSQHSILLKQTRHEIRENRKILQEHMLHSDMLYSLVGDLSVTERESRGKINDVIIPAIVRIETNIDGLWKTVKETRSSHVNEGTATDETLHLYPLPAHAADSGDVDRHAGDSAGGH